MQWLMQFLASPVLNAITGPFLEAYKAKLAAANSKDALAVQLAVKEIEADIEARKQAAAVIIAEQGRWWTALPRPLMAYIVCAYFAKVVIWDKLLALGSTDPLTGDVASWAGIIVTTYFGGRTIEKVARIFKR